MAISDGKPGHENQSLGIAENLPNPDILLLKHNLKEGFSEAVLRCRVRFLSGPKSNPENFLRKIFTENEIQRLKDHNPKAIISAGTLSAGPCLVAGYLTNDNADPQFLHAAGQQFLAVLCNFQARLSHHATLGRC